MKRNKTIIIISFITILLLLTVGITYAAFNYNRTGTNNSQLVAGDIYMHYNETNELTITNAMPQSTYTENNYFEFTIDGKNTYTEQDIWYEIVLTHGDNHETRTERLRDDLLKFRLVEVVDGEEQELFTNQSYDDLTNQRIWVDTIPRNTNTEIVKTYRLYMWVSDSIRIGNTAEADYDVDTWNTDVYASVKVNVTGDFNEKNLPVRNSSDFKELVVSNNTETCPTYVEEDGITYISGSSDCIDFNYVWYSGKLWRITAIYPNGTMKMITDDVITTISYGEDVNFYTDEGNSSYMYQWLNEDFLDTLVNSENIIVTDARWNATQTNSSITKPSETTLVTAPVGLLNSYEYYKSYENSRSSNGYGYSYGNGYLNIGYFWWLLNPYSSSNVWRVFEDGNPDNFISSSNATGARPSINLQSGITISGGTGTSSDPYTISGDKETITAGTTLLNTRVSGEYVKFDGELYRIVGIENNTTKLNKMDYVRDESDAVITKNFSSSVYGDGSSDTYWDYYLNNAWYNSISETYKNMLVEGTYYLGTVGYGVNYKASICATVSNTVTTTDCEKTSSTWTGYVGLPRYGEMFASQQGSGYSSSEFMWLITPDSSSYVWRIHSNGNAGKDSLSYYTHGARPSINLSSSVKITGGTGLKNDPFEISL